MPKKITLSEYFDEVERLGALIKRKKLSEEQAINKLLEFSQGQLNYEGARRYIQTCETVRSDFEATLKKFEANLPQALAYLVENLLKSSLPK
jgi:hypothetical protein